MSLESMKAVVMAGGEGSRLRPITANRPKPLTPICNRPILDHIFTLLKRHHVTKVVATVHYLADEIQATYGNGSDIGMDIAYSVEEFPLGTAGSVKQAEDLLSDATFIIVSGDALTDCDLEAAVAFHKSKKSVATLILSRVKNPLDFGVVVCDDESRIVRFLEKPNWSEVFSDTVNTGMYILEPEVFKRMTLGESCDWSADVFPQLLKEGAPIFGYVMDGYWCDVGSLTQYREAQEHLLRGEVDLPLDWDGVRSDASGIHLGPNASVDEAVTLVPPVCIGRNVRIKRGARIGPYTSIGDNTFIEENSVVERSVIWDNVYIGHNARISSAILGSRVIVKRDAEILEDAVIGDRCLIDAGAAVRPGVKIWPDKIIERGSTVTMSLIWGNRWRGSLFRDLGVAGLSNVEITPDFACRLGASFGSCFPPKSRIVTSRDSTRSSRMIKRAVIASLLSAGCDVLDLRSTATPISRHFVKASGAMGAMHIRKLPDNNRVTLMEMQDGRGVNVPRAMERKIETAFYREDFRRADPDALGQIEFASRAVEGYQHDFFELLEKSAAPHQKIRVVCDYGYTALASFFPAMMARLGVETMALNAFDDGKRSPRTEQDLDAHLANLGAIVKSVGYDMGVLFWSDGERMTLVDSDGSPVKGNALLAAMATLMSLVTPNSRFTVGITCPSHLEEILIQAGGTVTRSKSGTRALVDTAIESNADFAGDDNGGFIFPEMQNSFDAIYGFGKLITLLRKSGLTLKKVVEKLPEFHMAYETVRVPWETKGAVMRRLTEDSNGSRVELVDGVKIIQGSEWVLILPDAIEPIVHIYAEGPDDHTSRALAMRYVKKVEELQLDSGVAL